MSETALSEILIRLTAVEQRIGMADDRRLPAAATAQRYEISTRTLDRWVANPALGFPQPEVINGRRYWWLSHLHRWDLTRIRSSAAKAESPTAETP
jgi:predicted DNA-binding transcriptional regulator AlpA